MCIIILSLPPGAVVHYARIISERHTHTHTQDEYCTIALIRDNGDGGGATDKQLSAAGDDDGKRRRRRRNHYRNWFRRRSLAAASIPRDIKVFFYFKTMSGPQCTARSETREQTHNAHRINVVVVIIMTRTVVVRTAGEENNRDDHVASRRSERYRFVPSAGQTRKPVCPMTNTVTPMRSPPRHSHGNQF